MPPPDLGTLHWETAPDGTLRLMGLTLVPHELMLSPDSRKLAVTFYHGTSQQMALSATVVLDTRGDYHRLLAAESPGFDHFYTWLPDGRLLWVDDNGTVFLDYDNLNTPEPMRAVNAAVGNTAYLSSKEWANPDWRVDLNTGKWETIVDDAGHVPGMFRGVSHDGSYVLYTYTKSKIEELSTAVWRVPVEWGSPAEYVFSHHVEGYGSDGYFGFYAANLARTNIWAVSGPFSTGLDINSVGFDSILIDLDAKKVLTPNDLGLDDDYTILGGSISEDGSQLIVELTKNPRPAPNSAFAVTDEYYVTDRKLTGGTLSTERPSLEDVPFTLPDNSTIVFNSRFSDPLFVIVQVSSPSLKFERYDMEGNLLQTLDLSAEFDTLWGMQLAPSGDVVYFAVSHSALKQNGSCDNAVSLVKWPLK